MSMPGNSYDNLKALVVEDNAHMRVLLRSLLQALGIRSIHESSDGEAGFAELCARNPDIVLTDLGSTNGTFINDQRVELPVIHLKGDVTVVGKDPRPANLRPVQSGGEFFILDDPADPLVLNWRLKDPLYHDGNFRVEIIKINFPVAKPENVLEKQLTQEKRAVTYGIYFDFNRDTLKPESEPVLKEIAQAMTNNPAWKLTVEGHTDNIGGDPYNLDLSKRRAASVKQALVRQYNVAPDRLLTSGFGASRPIETNDTLEGRARNRRVELTRPCTAGR